MQNLIGFSSIRNLNQWQELPKIRNAVAKGTPPDPSPLGAKLADRRAACLRLHAAHELRLLVLPHVLVQHLVLLQVLARPPTRTIGLTTSPSKSETQLELPTTLMRW